MKFFRLSNINQSVTYSNQPNKNDCSTTLHLHHIEAFKPCPRLFSARPLFLFAGFCVRASADLPVCLADVTRCLQLAAAAAGGPSAKTKSVRGIKGPSPKKATGVGLRLVCSPRCCCDFWFVRNCILTLAAVQRGRLFFSLFFMCVQTHCNIHICTTVNKSKAVLIIPILMI